MPKGTKVLMELRITEVGKLLAQGYTYSAIMRYATEKGWDVNQRTIDTYIRKVYDSWRDQNKQTREDDLNWHIEARKKLFIASFKSDKHKVCLEILSDIAKLRGHYVEKIEHTGKDGGALEMVLMTAAERRQRIQELEVKRLVGGTDGTILA